MSRNGVWHFGNTTVRNATRLVGVVQVLKSSEFDGNMLGRERESDLSWFLEDEGIVSIMRTKEDDVSDLGRKWRSALSQLGFVAPETVGQLSQYSITRSGDNLIAAKSLHAQQEVFLRALSAYRIPSVVESRYAFPHSLRCDMLFVFSWR